MEPASVPFAPFAADVRACEACGLHPDELSSVARHVEHLAGDLSPVEQRQLRSHLFALLAAMTGVLTLPE
jgi:hypothetical protein